MALEQPLPSFGRRLRAAIALATKNQREVGTFKAELARELNISPRTLERMILDQSAPNDWEIARLVELLPVPGWFLKFGFEEIPPDSPEARLQRIEEKLDAALEAREAAAGGVPSERLEAGPEDRPRPPRPGAGPAGLR